jgi:hypothetical protein
MEDKIMLYQTAHVESGKLIVDNAKQIDQSKLTSDCWLVQFNGLEACETCGVKGTSECGGGDAMVKLQARAKTRKAGR